MKPELAAWQKHPEPRGTVYYAPDLGNQEIVEKLFAGCRDSEAYITSEGWQFLFQNYSLPELVQIMVASNWSGAAEGHSTLPHLVYQSLLAGYDPFSNQRGDYDTETGEFISLSGNVSKVDLEGLGK